MTNPKRTPGWSALCRFMRRYFGNWPLKARSGCKSTSRFWLLYLSDADIRRLHSIYGTFAAEAPTLNIMLQTYFEAVESYSDIVSLPVKGIGLDFVHGYAGNIRSIQASGFPQDKVLGAGVVDGRGIWKASLREKAALLEKLQSFVPADRIIVQSSCSLLHVPVTVSSETKLLPELKGALAFADEKLDELVLLTKAVSSGTDAIGKELDECDLAIRALERSKERNRNDVQQAVAAISKQDAKRSLPFAERHAVQQKKWRLPVLPTTTIGSFPQSVEVRKARQLWRKGEWSGEQYARFIREQIDTWIGLQEEIGLDVLVHGEFERTDMVEFFGEKLAGFAFTQYGWVQSYGSRCVKPPIIFGDVAFEKPMTVEETQYAQSKTSLARQRDAYRSDYDHELVVRPRGYFARADRLPIGLCLEARSRSIGEGRHRHDPGGRTCRPRRASPERERPGRISGMGRQSVPPDHLHGAGYDANSHAYVLLRVP